MSCPRTPPPYIYHMRPNDLHVPPAMINYSHEQTVLPVYVIIVVTGIGASYNTKYKRQNSKLKTSNFIHYCLAKHLTNVLSNLSCSKR